MEIDLSDKNLTEYEKREILSLMQREDKRLHSDLEQMWYLMDLVWDDLGCDNRHLDWERIGKFYAHPVWLLNGLFIEQDTESMGHRHSISDWVIAQGFSHVVDYGGGFGTLARLIAQKDPSIRVDIYEPHPSDFGLKRAAEYENIHMIEKLQMQYDCLISTDVLEHVPDPLADFAAMVSHVRAGGYLIIANAFFPMIKCHLPQNFHFRYTFNQFAKMMGVEVEGMIEGTHAVIFKKVGNVEPDWNRIRRYEMLSKAAFPLIEVLKPVLKPVKKMLLK